MKKLLLFLLCIFFSNSFVYASTDSAYEYVLMDMDSGNIIQSKNMHIPKLIASITKIMTCIIAIENKNLDDIVVVDDVIKDSFGSGIYISSGEEISLRDLLYGLMLRSGNDAALVISKYVSGSILEFVSLMNEKAKLIGMKNTVFYNPSGLDNDQGNLSTAYDMALLTRYAMKNEVYREIVKTKKYISKTNLKTYVWYNKNKLLSKDYITGGKTGYTEKAKRTLVSTASKNNMNFVVVTIKDSDDWNTHLSLYEYAFKNYYNIRVINKKNFKVIGDNLYDYLYVKNDVYLTIKKGSGNNLINHIVLNSNVKYDDKPVGTNNIYLDDKLLYTGEIYAKKNNNRVKKWFW